MGGLTGWYYPWDSIGYGSGKGAGGGNGKYDSSNVGYAGRGDGFNAEEYLFFDRWGGCGSGCGIAEIYNRRGKGFGCGSGDGCGKGEENCTGNGEEWHESKQS